ncbi:hypothetical protein A5M85_09040 [Cellulophaga lytica]|uniref:hypothetical protein n=1 Tax=Cellulophaga lytica TaxID=979 RepID=UPI000950A8E5|nr:hypothetical protein [Cellulophaga lytica]APU10422.1 hypothetical protein A5M85_09040 [Cellulophaga lytica]
MKTKNNGITINFLIALAILILILPMGIFLFKFKNQLVSSEISDWASFGDYIGGVVNTIISLLSLIVLGYITFLVSKQSNLENKKLNILQRKLDAYDELTKYSPKINHFISNLGRVINSLTKSLESANSLIDNDFLSKNDKVINQLDLFVEFHYFLSSFKVRYSHLFEYDFDNEEFQKLLESTKGIKDYFKSVMIKFDLFEGELSELPDFDIFNNRFVNFINMLRNELK